QTTIYEASKAPADANAKVKAIAGTAEFLRLLPKSFAIVKAIDPAAHQVTLLLDGDRLAKGWPLEPDAEVKIGGWWGRLEQVKPNDRVWVWLKLDRKKTRVSVVMLADDVSEFDMHSTLRKPSGAAAPMFTQEQIDDRRSKQKEWLRQQWTEQG